MIAPRVTVLMGVYNGERYLAEAVRSILTQTFRDFEFLVVDDGSTDRTAEILAGCDDPRLRVIRNATNCGLTRALNTGLKAARGELIARQDADDVSHRERLARQVAYLDSRPDVAAVGSQVCAIDEHGGRGRHGSWVRCSGGAAMAWQMMFESPFAHSAVMFRRGVVWGELGGYDETYRTSQDFDLWSRLFRRGHGLQNLPERLIAFRSHPHSVSKSYSKEGLEKVRATLQANMEHVLGPGDYQRWLDFWVTVNNPATFGVVLHAGAFLDELRALQRRFAQVYPEAAGDREIRRHTAAFVARVSATTAMQDRSAAAVGYLAAVRLDAPFAIRSLPRFGACLLMGSRRRPRRTNPSEL